MGSSHSSPQSATNLPIVPGIRPDEEKKAKLTRDIFIATLVILLLVIFLIAFIYFRKGYSQPSLFGRKH